MKQSMLCYSLLSGVLCIHLLAPKCLAAKSFGVSDELLGFARGLPTLRENALQRQNSSLVENPDSVVKMVERSINESRRKLDFLPCQSGNPIDDCWRCDPDWQLNRQRLADCSIGFGRNAIGGKNGPYYVVSDPSDNDAVNPLPGTLRHAVIQSGPLWIVFQRDMIIQLKEELIMNSYKTIDGRGVNVHIANGPCITIQYVNNIIIHGVNIHDCIPGGNAMVRDSPVHYGWRTISDGDGISIFGANHIWIDHCTLSNCKDGLIDAIMGSTAITISNSYFTHHNEVMLLGHNDNYVQDSIMQVTIAFNHFGEGLVQRMPRCRHGYFHIVNNDYTYWEMYAIGGSASPTINSQGNRFLAPMDPNAKEVTKRLNAGDGEWKGWNWRSEGDLMLNGAYFIPSGAGAAASYDRASSTLARPAALVGTLTGQAGVLTCSSDCSISGSGSGGSSGIGSGGGIGGGIGSGSGMGGGGYMGGIGGNGGYNGGTIGMGGAQVLLASHHIIYCIVCFACFVLMLDIRA